MSLLRRILFCGAAVVFASAAVAAEDPEPIVMPPLHVSASRLPTRLDEVAASVTTLDRERIRALAPASTAELFRGIAGVSVEGGGAGPAYLHLRGADPNLTLILVDGVAVNDPTDSRGGSFDLREIDPEEIESVEIVRGPVSAVHGSDALAGVISITTRLAHGGEGRAWSRTEFGDFEYRSLAAGLGGAGASSSWQVRGRVRDGGQDVGGQEHRSRGAGAKGSVQLGAKTPLSWSFAAHSDHELRYREDSGGPVYAASRDLEEENRDRIQFATRLTTSVGERHRLGLRVTTLDLSRRLDSPAIAPGARAPVPATTNHDELRRSEVGIDLTLADGATRAVLGLEAEFEEGHSKGTLDQGFVIPTDFDRNRRTGSVFAEVSHTTSQALTVEAAGRLDSFDALAPEWTFRAGTSWRVGDRGVRVHLSGAQGVKTPSFFAVAHPLVGNPGLEVERSRSVEAGLAYHSSDRRLEVGLTAFLADYDQLIDFDSTIFKMVNRDDVRAEGGEARVRSQFSKRVEGGAQVAYTTTEIRDTGAALQDRPEWTASADVGISPVAHWKVRARGLYQGRVPDSSVPTGDRDRDAYFRLDLSSSIELGDQFELAVAVENLLDEDYEEAVGIPGRGRFARIGIRAQR